MPFLCSASGLSPFLFVPLPLVSTTPLFQNLTLQPFCMHDFVLVTVSIQLTLANICIPVAMVPGQQMIWYFQLYAFLKKVEFMWVIWGKPCVFRMEDSFCAHLGTAGLSQSSVLLQIISVFSFKRPWVTKGFCDCVIIQLLMSYMLALDQRRDNLKCSESHCIWSTVGSTCWNVASAETRTGINWNHK